jgi:glycosyltransferase involved in cell wall biosynthesis
MRIAYIVPTSEVLTYIYNEMIEVQAAGHDLMIVPLRMASPFHVPLRTLDHLKPDKIFPARLCNATIVSLSVYVLLTRPWRVLRTLLSLHWAAGINPFVHAGILAVTPKALATAWWLDKCGVHRIHAHFASHTATCAGIASAVSGIPFSFTAHAYDIYCTAISLHNGTLGWKLRHALQVFVISEYGRDLLRSRLSQFDRDRIHKVYVGIPLDLFKEKAPPPINKNLQLICIAYFDKKKGLDTLLDACALLKTQSIPFHLQLYGEGPLREALANQIARLDLHQHVKLGSPIPQELVAEELAASHIFVMPCRMDPKTGNIDGIPTVFMEAMATGRPVISCPLSGIPELVRHGETGLLVQPDDPAALAKAIIHLMLNESLRIQLGKQARALVEKQHDQRMNTRQLLDLMISVGSAAVYRPNENR